MATPIQALPLEVIHLMAAGEVIDALAAVVRELAENAIDAEATRISIALWSESWRVRVTDNGSGMTLPDLEQAALAHSTSKIQTQADLWQINSLGFRGEALHSLARLAELEICSRSRRVEQSDHSGGYQVSYSQEGQPQQIQPIAMAVGTSVTAANLFGSWPSRRQGLPLQLRGVQQAIQHLALCHPQITWQVEHNDRPWFSIWASPTAAAILTQLLRLQPGDLRSVVWRTGVWPTGAEILEPEASKPIDKAQLELLLGLPDRCHRRRLDWLKIAVNGRMVRPLELEQTLLASLRRTLPRDRYPVGFLHLHLPPDQVDWNRHPAKAELYLHQPEFWQAQTQQAVEQLLTLGEQTSLADQRLGQLIRAAEAEGVYRTGLEDADELVEPSRPLVPLRAVAQVHSMYILAEHPSGMWLIEQHIAHERVLYEQLCDRWQLVPLEVPLVLGQLSPAQQTQLQRLGLMPEAFGEDRWAVRTAPATLAQRDDCAAALVELSLGGDLDSALVATACRTAIRNGMPLTLPEMQSLLDQWQATRHPRTCPHGRPIYLSFEESSLARFFRRHWVIGKSHGI